MAVVSRTIKHSRRATLLRGARQVLASWWLSVLAYVLLLVLGYVLLTPAFDWSQRQLDDIRYGFPRTTQFTAFVGHHEDNGDPTQFIALNLNGQVSILELPGGDTTQVRALQGPPGGCRWTLCGATTRNPGCQWGWGHRSAAPDPPGGYCVHQ
ncbi:MAG: hypothetical protein GFH27_549283n121 [Chloroflexi bacterium AL-W]|nr:hypothetical protein [Chloroflexi bacterium AL-N1]NOK64758.1 hypothetical protein [Chloroflexi bacterium AL-N10]NOK75999.1 hypothetical protein [Chloroflexi bacterium AL-N5]NOK80242.1 hypothetical protein [Chloroflexi bacterium AL-W]NOK86755.1 hypothetical protein [Chloroflexi bacterium AL-N15]